MNIKPIKKALAENAPDLTVVRLPGSPPQWAVLGLNPTQIISFSKGRWKTSSRQLANLIKAR